MKQILMLLLIFTLSSCNESSKKEKRKQYDRLAGNDYKIALFNINLGNNREETEVYITKKGDTLINQYKLFKNGKISVNESEYYDLLIYKTNEPNVYQGKITLHTYYENLKLDKANRRTVNFGFCEQSKDSISLKYIESKKSNTIEFKFHNYYNNRLQGRIYQLVYRDTIINGEKMLNMRETNLIVDNFSETNNLFVDVDTLKKKRKFNTGNLKLTPKN